MVTSHVVKKTSFYGPLTVIDIKRNLKQSITLNIKTQVMLKTTETS